MGVAEGDADGAIDGDADGLPVASVGACVLSQHNLYSPLSIGQHGSNASAPSCVAAHRGWLPHDRTVVGLSVGATVG